MTTQAATNPTLDLTNCDREAIHLLGSIQPFGALIAVNNDWHITALSKNVTELSGIAEPSLFDQRIDQLVTLNARKLIVEASHWLKNPDDVERRFEVPLFKDEDLYDIAIYRASEDTLIIEAEKHHALTDQQPLLKLRTDLKRIMAHEDTQALLSQAAETVKELCGFDRVIVYQFNEDQSGKVVAESREPGIDSFLDMCFPASDIPKQARSLFVRNTCRIISDLEAKDIAIQTNGSFSATDIDLSMSTCRTVSKMHSEYLLNMGIKASMSLAIVKDGELWGLFACHNHSPKHVPYPVRSLAELFGEMFATEFGARLSHLDRQREVISEQIREALLENIQEEKLVFNHMKPLLANIQAMIPCDGVVLKTKEGTLSHHMDIDDGEINGFINELGPLSNKEILTRNHLGGIESSLISEKNPMAGVMMIPLSMSNPDILMLFRKEEVKTVSWAGDPTKPVISGPNGDRLTPRKSFDLWKEIRRGYARPWSDKDKNAANKLRYTLLDVILQNIDERERIRNQAKDRQDILVQELNHRVRNILGLIRGVTNRTADSSSTIDEFKTLLNGRIQALASAYDQLTEKDWASASLTQLIKKELDAFNEHDSSITLNPKDLELTAPAFSCLTLVIHEMVTNASKHGALKDNTGKLNIDWKEFNDNLVIEWTERTSWPINEPTTRGFGSTIIERSIPFELDGQAEVSYPPEGFTARFSIPISYVVKNESNTRTDKGQSGIGEAIMKAKKVLILEDNVLIAMDVYDIFKARDAEKVWVKSNNHDSIKLLQTENVDFVVLDIYLGHETSFATADACLEYNVPYVFATGYDMSYEIPAAHRDVPIINKPFNDKSFNLL
jgi:light-regulated signal transduction histidine kinase (bacteriophytochrome)